MGNGARAFRACRARRAGRRSDEHRLTEIYEPPFPAYGARGGDIDRNGVFWASFASGHLGAFDRRKCKGPLNGPQASGKHCPEGWTLYRFPGPQFRDVQDDGSAEASYYVWVDWFNALGLGENVPIATGNMSERTSRWSTESSSRCACPTRRASSPSGPKGASTIRPRGWRGRGLWATYSTRAVFHSEGGTRSRPRVVKFQLPQLGLLLLEREQAFFWRSPRRSRRGRRPCAPRGGRARRAPPGSRRTRCRPRAPRPARRWPARSRGRCASRRAECGAARPTRGAGTRCRGCRAAGAREACFALDERKDSLLQLAQVARDDFGLAELLGEQPAAAPDHPPA